MYVCICVYIYIYVFYYMVYGTWCVHIYIYIYIHILGPDVFWGTSPTPKAAADSEGARADYGISDCIMYMCMCLHIYI